MQSPNFQIYTQPLLAERRELNILKKVEPKKNQRKASAAKHWAAVSSKGALSAHAPGFI